jgi:long-chain acyl-CoA synthetase
MNLADILARGAQYFPEKEAIIFGDMSYTYRDLNSIIDRIASYLQDQGVSKGDKVSLYLANCPEWIMVYYAIIRLGAIAVCLSSFYKQAEVERLVNDSDSCLVITSEQLLPQMPNSQNIPNVKDILLVENDGFPLSLFEKNEKRGRPVQGVDCDCDDVCIMLYTGGTTGMPKGAMLTHKNILYTAQNVCYHERMVPEDVGLCFMPLNHVFGNIHIMNSIFYGCGTLSLHRGFDMDEIISSIHTNKVTRFYAVPTAFIRLLNNPASKKYLSSLGYCFSAATSMPSEIVREWKEQFGVNIHEAYGMTESSSLVTFNHMCRHKVGSVGTPGGIVEVKIVDPENKEVPTGEKGEIIVRGPNIMKAYYNKPEETAKTLINGWLHSGDVGHVDEEGYLYIVDRIKDMIISGGLNVYPTEVEEILFTHEAVEECAVVGTPHEEYGESVTAFISLKEGKASSEDDLIRFCKKRMASYKAPKRAIFVKDFPKSPQGKILKRELRKYEL